MKKDQHYPSTSLLDKDKDTNNSPFETVIIKSKGIEFICLIDPENLELVSRYKWNLHSRGYAATTIKGKTILMHRLIMGVDDPKIEVDHQFHNKLDNRKANLRPCTPAENRRNSRKLKKGTSKLKGVYKDGKYWHVQIKVGSRIINKGRFRSEKTAGKVYDCSARLVFKEFAFLNFPGLIELKQLTIPGFL